jgi:hypothetical protein
MEPVVGLGRRRKVVTGCNVLDLQVTPDERAAFCNA